MLTELYAFAGQLNSSTHLRALLILQAPRRFGPRNWRHWALLFLQQKSLRYWYYGLGTIDSGTRCYDSGTIIGGELTLVGAVLQLCAGASPEERRKYHLRSADSFTILSASKCLTVQYTFNSHSTYIQLTFNLHSKEINKEHAYAGTTE